MKKKRPQQQATPPTKELKILAVKRSPKHVEPPQEQSAAVSIEQPVVDAASAPEPVNKGVGSRESGVGSRDEDSDPAQDNRPNEEGNREENRLPTPHSPLPHLRGLVVPTPVDELAHTDKASSASSPELDALASSPERRERGEKGDREGQEEKNSPALPGEQEVCFQAVGIIKGDITLCEDKTFVTIGGKPYELYYAGNHKMAYEALKKEIENTGITQQRLIVYPKITHYPGGKQPYRLGFQVAGFVGHSASGEGLQSVLEDLEFKISGLWQFIPVCRVPCISVFKNFNKQRLEYIKSAPVDKKVNFMKASHIPVMWRDAPVPPFRFNPKLDKETQGKASFVQIKARFNSVRDNFEFVELLGIPTEEPPNYLKAGKKDKAEAVKSKRASKAQERSSMPVSENNAAPTPREAASKPKPKPKVVAAQQ